MITTAYYDRSQGTINGSFSVQTSLDGLVVENFSKIQARSGQRGFDDSWTPAKSPIPYSTEILGEYSLWLTNQNQKGQWAFGSGIGEFWAISTEEDRVTIKGKNGKIRREIGAHPENEFPGSAGCIVLVAESELQKQRILAVRNYLIFLRDTRKLQKIKLIVL